MKKVIGFNGVLDSLRKGRVKEVVVDPSKKSSSRVKEIIKSGVKIIWRETPNVVEALISSKSRKIDKILESLSKKDNSTVVILDHIQDSGNFGAIIRSCDAFGVDLIVYPNRNSVKLSDTVIKISAGSYANVDVIEVANIVNIIEKLKSIGFWIYGTAANGSRKYKEGFEKKCCIVMGSEESGMKKIVESSCDFLVSIPIRIESLNVSHACSILLSEVYSER